MGHTPKLLFILLSFFFGLATACTDGKCRLLDKCYTDQDCGGGLYCFSCPQGFSGSRCVRSSITDQFKVLNNSLPFNKYAFLTTHNSYAIDGEPSHTGVRRLTFTNQEDNVTQQLKNGARALMLDTYDFEGDVWLCHSFGGECHDYTAFEPAIDTLREVEAFLSANPVEIVTIILEDYVKAPNGLTKVFTDAGLMKYWFPVTSMPGDGEDWPLVSDMVAKNQRLIVFTSIKSKQETEGIAYQWNYMVENQYGDGGMHRGNCPARAESAPLNDRTKSLVLVNYFKTIPLKQPTCEQNSGNLINMLHTCYGAAGNRWANFVAVDYYKRSEGGGSFQAIDTMNAKLLCGCDDIHACVIWKTNNSRQFRSHTRFGKLMAANNSGSMSTADCSNGGCQLHDRCSSDGDCAAGLFCFSCSKLLSPNKCVRTTVTNQFSLINNSLPFNKYSFLTTHNSFAITGEPSHTGIPRLAPACQEDSITDQLRNGVRALMLDTYDFKEDVWLCHSFDGKCFDITAFGPALDTFREIEAFLSANPTEIVTLILEDYVKTPNALTKVFTDAGLKKYWFPVESMPQNGQDWPLVSDMVAKNQRLVVFTSAKYKQQSEGIAHQWTYMVENQYGDDGLHGGNCANRGESQPLNDKTKSLVLVNYFMTTPIKLPTCELNSKPLVDMLGTCYGAAGNRWANFVAVNFYKRSDGEGSFQAVDTMNGQLLCGSNDVHACVHKSR